MKSLTAASAIGPSAASTGEARTLHCPATRRNAGGQLGLGDASRVKRGEARERRFGRLGVMSERRADIVDRRAKRDRLRQKIAGQIRALGHAFPEPVGLLDGQRLRVSQPLHDVSGLAEVVLM